MTRRRRAAVAAVWLAVLCAAGVRASAAELVVWHAYRGEQQAAFDKVVAMYNARAGGPVVETRAVPEDAFADKIGAAIPLGRGPDVFVFAHDRLGGWVEGDRAVESLERYLDEETVDSLLPGMMAPVTYRGTVYGLPLNYRSITLVYNKDLVSDPPASSSELVAVAKGLTSEAAGAWGLAYEYSNYAFHAALVNAFGGAVFDGRGRPVIDQRANVEAAKLLLRWFRQDRILPADPSAALVGALFESGHAAMVFAGPSFLAGIRGVDYGLAPLPVIEEAGGRPMQPWLTVEGVYLSPACADPEAGYAFARFLVSADAARVLALEGRQLPTNRAVYADPAVAADPVIGAFRRQLDTAVPMPNRAEMHLAWSPVTTAMNRIVKGSASPEAALQEAQKEVLGSLEARGRGQ